MQYQYISCNHKPDINYEQENWRCKKLVVAIDKDRVRTRGLLLETDVRSENILSHLRDQEAHHIINDYTIDKVT